MEYLKEHWDITSEFSVVPIYNCMLRGMTSKDTDDQSPVKKSGNTNVYLSKRNIPPHMHHSSVTVGGNMECMAVDGSSDDRLSENGIRYDMFCNDSFSTGLRNNELDGTGDAFKV